MREQLIQYVKLLFAGTPGAEDMQQEILQNTLDRYDDLIDQGKPAEAAYRLAIAGIGDIHEILCDTPSAPVPETAKPSTVPEVRPRKKLLLAIAIGLYICCVIPVILSDALGNDTIGVCLMFVMVAAATVLIVLSSNTNNGEEISETPKKTGRKAEKSLWGTLTLVLYLALSFATKAWYITWLVFPIAGTVKGLIKALRDYKEAGKYES